MDENVIQEIINTIGNSEGESRDTYKVNKRRRILAMLAKAGVSIEAYEKALSFTAVGVKVTQERDITELYINSYNVEWLRAWNGNMDMSTCFDYHAVITYITDYFSKDDTGLMKLLQLVIEHNPSESFKEQMKLVANTFLTHRQIGEAEAVYRLLPNMLLKNSNVTCQWLSVGKRSDLSKRWKLANEKELEQGVGLIKIKDREGWWIEQSDMLSKYLRRPNSLENISASQFAKMYTTSGLRHKRLENESEEEEYSDNEIENQTEDEEIMRNPMDHIIAGNVCGSKLPKYILLKDPMPREPKLMRKRTKPAVLRYHKGSKDQQYESWMLKELMLYTPFRREDLDRYEESTAETYKEKQDWIKGVKTKVMEHLESVEEARLMVEQSNKDENLELIGNEINATHEQEKDDCAEEGVSEHPDYIHLDTDGISLDDRPNQQSSLFKQFEIPSKEALVKETRKLDCNQREILNIAIRYARDLVKSRRDGNEAPNPVYLIGHGGAGAGKSTVINLVSQWCHLILSKSGDDANCPYILKTAFTGTAASNIEGQTLHTSFSFNFDNKHYSLSDKKRDEKRQIFKNLAILIIDEVSMVKSDMLYQLDLKLQEVKERTDIAFGGVTILAFGDILQLRPVLGGFPFEKPKNPDFHATFTLQNRWEMFQVLNLTVNHRQGKDKDYADMLNRIRIGKLTPEDCTKLRTRVRPKGHPDLKDVSVHIVPTRKACAKYNSDYLNSLKEDEIHLKANHYNTTQKNFKPFIEKKEGAIGTTSFLDEIHLKLGCDVILIHNVDTSDGLTNGQMGKLVSIIHSSNGKPDKLIINLQKKSAGVRNRKRFPDIAAKFPDAVIIEKVSINYSLRKKGGVVGATATLVQFPVKVAHAITSHKIQGQTIPKPLKVAFDLLNIFEEAQGYVMLSRVQEFNQVFILDDFDESKIYPSRKALKELERMNSVAVNNNPGPWKKNVKGTIKIVFMNCAGIKPHFEDIKIDVQLRHANMIQLLETSLQDHDIEEEYELSGYSQSFIKKGNGKGLASYFEEDKFTTSEKISSDQFQIIKQRHEKVDVICIYRSQLGNSSLLLDNLQQLIDLKRVTIVIGDFNACYRENSQNKVIQGLLHLGFSQLVHEPTHIRGRILDHMYILDSREQMTVAIERYSPYYTDHDAICISITEKAEVP